MRLVAKVRPASERKTLWDDEQGDADLVYSPLTTPTLVEIIQLNEEIHLLRLNSSGNCISDTWHASIDAAKEQASLEYEVREADWILLVMRQ